jgi:hypothetical protein
MYMKMTEEVSRKGTKNAAAESTMQGDKSAYDKVSAFDILRRTMAENGLEGLADAAIDAIMKEESTQVVFCITSSPAYKLRFSC